MGGFFPRDGFLFPFSLLSSFWSFQRKDKCWRFANGPKQKWERTWREHHFSCRLYWSFPLKLINKNGDKRTGQLMGRARNSFILDASLPKNLNITFFSNLFLSGLNSPCPLVTTVFPLSESNHTAYAGTDNGAHELNSFKRKSTTALTKSAWQ